MPSSPRLTRRFRHPPRTHYYKKKTWKICAEINHAKANEATRIRPLHLVNFIDFYRSQAHKKGDNRRKRIPYIFFFDFDRCLQFQRRREEEEKTPKRVRNPLIVYWICGWLRQFFDGLFRQHQQLLTSYH